MDLMGRAGSDFEPCKISGRGKFALPRSFKFKEFALFGGDHMLKPLFGCFGSLWWEKLDTLVIQQWLCLCILFDPVLGYMSRRRPFVPKLGALNLKELRIVCSEWNNSTYNLNDVWGPSNTVAQLNLSCVPNLRVLQLIGIQLPVDIELKDHTFEMPWLVLNLVSGLALERVWLSFKLIFSDLLLEAPWVGRSTSSSSSGSSAAKIFGLVSDMPRPFCVRPAAEDAPWLETVNIKDMSRYVTRAAKDLVEALVKTTRADLEEMNVAIFAGMRSTGVPEPTFPAVTVPTSGTSRYELKYYDEPIGFESTVEAMVKAANLAEKWPRAPPFK
jgi:hypothetical protein